MSENVCPSCRQPIDPASALARVRGAKVVSFCSEACANAPDPLPEAPPIEPEPPEVEVPTRAPRMSGKRRVAYLSVAVLAGGMVITIVGAVSPSSPSDVRASTDGPHAVERAPVEPISPAPDVREPDTEPPGVDLAPDALRARALEVLRELSALPSQRLARMAAMALARTGDADALAALVALHERETSALGRIAIDYALARSGDRDAHGRLRVELGHKKRDVRLDAARALVQLGDRAGAKLLRRTLRLRRHRVGAAGLLARLGDKEGFNLLRRVMSDRRTSREGKMRAAVALGRAGDDRVRARLVEILSDGRYHVGAADALAVLGDNAAIPALTAQLDLDSIRVRAALGLRRLGAEVDLMPLAVALEQGRDSAKVTAAEAILVLVGPAEWSERD